MSPAALPPPQHNTPPPQHNTQPHNTPPVTPPAEPGGLEFPSLLQRFQSLGLLELLLTRLAFHFLALGVGVVGVGWSVLGVLGVGVGVLWALWCVWVWVWVGVVRVAVWVLRVRRGCIVHSKDANNPTTNNKKKHTTKRTQTTPPPPLPLPFPHLCVRQPCPCLLQHLLLVLIHVHGVWSRGFGLGVRVDLTGAEAAGVLGGLR